MTCIIGFVDTKQRIMTIAGDRLASDGRTKAMVGRPKVFKRKKLLFGTMGSFRFGQILEYHLLPPKNTRKTSFAYIIRDLIPHIRSILEEHKYADLDEDGICGFALLLYNGCVYEIQSDWSVLEHTTEMSIGSGKEVAMGAMIALRNTDTKPRKKAAIVLDAAAECIQGVGYGKYDIIELTY